MCGVIGYWSGAATTAASASDLLTRAVLSLAHRGPDDFGIWCEHSVGFAVGHTRLSIVDLSVAGHQPMVSDCGRYVIAFNGEIYNHMQLRQDLEDSRKLCLAPLPVGQMEKEWRGHSDTETLLRCFVLWGVEKTLQACVGMFAIALWDRLKKTLVLARDRFGEKPLYYGFLNNEFAFGSELKAIRTLPGFTGEIERGAISLLMRHSYVPAPHCIYKGLRKLEPGSWVELRVEDVRSKKLPAPLAYWSALDVAINGLSRPFHFSDDSSATNALERVLTSAVARQMMADVPIGAFLSGGIDSSAVVALMQRQSSRPIRTFCIGFDEASHNEAIHAAAVARHLGTLHTELYVSHHDALAAIPRLPTVYDEPFSDSSQIPTLLLAQMAACHVKVSLSGDGGDEMFGGYVRHIRAERAWRRINRIPILFRKMAQRAILSTPARFLDAGHRTYTAAFQKARGSPSIGSSLHKAAGLLTSSSGSELYDGLVSHWRAEEIVINPGVLPTKSLADYGGLGCLTNSMLLVDSINYLPDDILVKVDRAAMAASLETRVPLIDHNVFDFAWRLPLHYKIRHGVGKWLLRQVLYSHVPKELVDRPKMGFAVPIGIWLRGPLREWAESLLSESRLRNDGYFHPEPIRRKWREHISGRYNWQHHLWDVLIFQAWLDETRQ